MKRLVVFLVLLASMLSIKAAEMYVVKSTDGSTITFYYDDLKSSREGEVYEIDEWSNLRFNSSKKKDITSAVFDASFKNARPTDTSYWFCYLTNMESIENLQYLNTSAVEDMSNMFRDCSSLKSLDVSHFDTPNVWNMSNMFRNCSSLTNLDLSSFYTYNVTDMNHMFIDCSNLVSVDVSHFDTNCVTDMCGMFYNCSKLESLDLSHFTTWNVMNMSGMFAGCYSLKNLDVSHFDTSCVEDMQDMFIGCCSLTTLDVSHFSTRYVTNMSKMFWGCEKLTNLDVSHFDTGSVKSMYAMFRDCYNLTSLDLSNFYTDIVMDGDAFAEMFWNCKSLTSLDLSSFNTCYAKFMFNMFNGCSSLTSLDLSSFDTSNVTDMGFMFRDCSSLTSVVVGNFNTSKVDYMGGMFSGCSSLTSLDVSNFDTRKVTNMSYMFEGCSSLTTLDLSNFYTNKVADMSNILSGCSNLATLDISNFNISNVQNISNMCKDVASAQNPCLLKVPEGFDYREDIDFSGNYFMWQCGYFRLPETDKLKVEPVTIFKGSPSTMAIELKNPSSKKYIGYQFKIVLPEGVSICKKDNGQYSYTQGNRYGNTQMMMNIREQNDCSYMVLCFSLSNTPISGHEGAILSLDITSDGSLDDGSYEGAIRGIKFSTPEGSDVLLPDATFKVNVSKYELGDVNNDGSVSISDITLAVNYILGKASDKFHASHADMNHDGEINISDLSEMVEIILNSGNNAPVNIGVSGGLRMESAGSECSLYLPDAGLYMGCQFLVRVPSGCRLSDVSVGAGRESGHRVMFRQTGTGLYKVLVFSADGNEFEDVPSALLRLTVDGQNGGAVELSDIRFTDSDFTEHGFAAVSSEVTGIGAVAKGVSESTWYSLDGQKTAQPTKGVFVRDGRKIVVK